MNLHAHVRMDATDCDGRIQRGHIRLAEPGETEEHFKIETIGSYLLDLEESGQVDIQSGGFSVWEPTEEGSRTVHVTWCDSNCENIRSTVRDYEAEKAGY